MATRQVGSHSRPGGIARDDERLLNPDSGGIAGDRPQALRRQHLRIGLAGPVGRAAFGGDELDQPKLRHPLQPLEVADLETLDEHGVCGRSVAEAVEEGDERLLDRQAQRAEIGRMLGLGIKADPPAEALFLGLDHPDDLLKRRDGLLPVVGGACRAKPGKPLARPERLELGQREILREPAGDRPAVDRLGRAPAGEFGAGGNVGRLGDLVLVPGNEHPVAGDHEVRLDEVRPLLDRQFIGGQRVLRPVAAGAAVGDDQRRRAVQGRVRPARRRRPRVRLRRQRLGEERRGGRQQPAPHRIDG
jgi:hypothetical protein